MSFPKYPAYKPSGVEWLGEVPAHWNIIQSRRIFSQRKDRAKDGSRQLTASQKYGIIYQDDFMTIEGQKVVQVIHGADILKQVEKGDFVISMRSFQSGIEWSNLSGSISSAYVMLIPANQVHPGFFRYLFKSQPYIQALQSTTNLVRDGQALRFDNFVQVDLPVVPWVEQEAIANLLDRETTKIDALIAEQEQLITLLKEKRQAVISHAVTKGLDASAPMKDSGVAWLGEVPAHWQIKALKFVATVQTGIAKGKDNAGKATIMVPYLRVANVQDGYLDLEDVAEIEIPESDLPRYLLQDGDVLMNEGGDFDKLGRGHVWRSEISPCVHQNHVFSVRPHSVSSEWLNKVTSSEYAQFYFMSRSKQSTNLASISSSSLMDLPVILPPEAEQNHLLVHIRQTTEQLSNLLAEAGQSIDLLRERRSALISAAVTGQIDVREVA